MQVAASIQEMPSARWLARISLARVFWASVALAAIAAVYAVSNARDLVYDGSFYLLGIAAHGDFQFYEPPRRAVAILQQCFAVAGERLGDRSLWSLGQLYSLGCSGWPIVLTALCWLVLPRGQKSWILGPLLDLVIAIPATGFIGVGEGIIASCLLWLAFLLIQFRSKNPGGALAALAATAACAFTHEAAVVCLLLIACASLLRLSDAKGSCRIAVLLAGVIALAGAGNMLRWIIVPRSAVERGDFLASVGGFLGWPSDPNIPAAASVIAAAAILAALIVKGRRARTAALIAPVIIFALVVILFVGADRVIAPSRFFAARALPVALTTLTMGCFLVLWWRGETPERFATPAVLTVVLSLAICHAAAQAIVTQRWSLYVQALSGLVDTERGVVPHVLAMQRLDPHNDRFRRELLETWSVEPLAILLAPHGRVQAFVEAAPEERWVPYNPYKSGKLPHPPGLDWSNFVPRPAR